MRAPPGPMSGLFAGRYTLERVIGLGATAMVHLARDTKRGTAVAIKILRPELAESGASDRFLKEIRRTTALQHPHILPVLDSGEYEGQPYFVLPYMEGGTLRLLMKREKSLELTKVIEIARPIAEALDYAHKRGLIHRDVKPENILFTDGQACLGDFGIARALEMSGGFGETTSTSRNTVRGTPAYMSPEQAAGGTELDGRSDIYSWACVLFEMITGMQAFIGPSPESVISQRFAHPPREVRVYRPAAPPAIDDVLAKAFAITPADRYRTATDFIDAVQTAIDSPNAGRTENGGRTLRQYIGLRRNRYIAGFIIAMTTLWGFSELAAAQRTRRAIVAADTTSILVLPVEGDTSLPLTQFHNRLYGALGRWKGVKLAHGGERPPDRAAVRTLGSDSELRRHAAMTGHGRFIRTRAVRAGSELRAFIALHDVRTGQRLYEAPLRSDVSLNASDDAFRAVADSILLRGAGENATGSTFLPAVQGLAKALVLIRDWDLPAADTLLSAVVELDPNFSRASLWLAEVRAVQRKLASEWRPAAERAVKLGGLSMSETHLAHGLLALSNARFDEACDKFERMRRADSTDFVAWYGLGQCRHMDSLVVRDYRSRSGWSFRSSRHRATQAFARAFMLRPMLHRSVRAGEFRTMRTLLVTNVTVVRSGYSAAPNNTFFMAYPEWQGDTLAFIPYPFSVIGAGLARYDPQAVRLAVQKQRALFIEITRSWAAALPQSAGPKEALAISLEMMGDRSAIDTIRAARRLAQDPYYQLELAAVEVFLRVEFASLRDSADMHSARTMADSLLAAHRRPSPEYARILAPIAALLGRCRLAAQLGVYQDLDQNALRGSRDSVNILLASGCESRVSQEFISRGIRGIAADPGLRREAGNSELDFELWLIGRATSVGFPLDSSRVVRLAAARADYLLQAESAVLRGDGETARSILMRQLSRRGAIVGTPDALYAEARVWLLLGDSARAQSWLDPLLERDGWLTSLPHNAVMISSLMRSLVLRVQLAYAAEEEKVAEEWGRAIATLWATADAQLRATLPTATNRGS
jgi:hypothetical protein